MIHFNGHDLPVKLKFRPYQSLMVNISEKGRVRFEDVYFKPGEPVGEGR
jgi:hypothetical protein